MQITRSDKVKGPVSVHRLIKDGIFPEKTGTSGNNEMNREIMLEMFKLRGFKTDVAFDGHQAITKILQAEPGTYDIVLMDVQMPVMDGYEATRQIRKFSDKKRANIPIIAMTANAFEEDKKAAYDAGMNEHVAKPIVADILIDTMYRVLYEK